MSTHDDCTGYDFAAGHATGLRSFNVDSLGRLKGVTYPRVWKPGENVADCNKSEARDAGRCDDDSHGCGFWAYHDGSTYDAGQVRGVVEGYGRTTVGAKGFRAEKARIVALHIPTRKPPKKRSAWDWLCIWADRHDGPILGIGIPAFVASGTPLILAFAGAAPALLGALAAPVCGAALVLFVACFAGIGKAPSSYTSVLSFYDDGERLVSDELAAKVRRNYPDVKFYDSVQEMKAAHPVDKALEPSPETDPTFWDDEPIDESPSTMTWAVPSATTWRMSNSYWRSIGGGGAR